MPIILFHQSFMHFDMQCQNCWEKGDYFIMGTGLFGVVRNSHYKDCAVTVLKIHRQKEPLKDYSDLRAD